MHIRAMYVMETRHVARGDWKKSGGHLTHIPVAATEQRAAAASTSEHLPPVLPDTCP